MSWLFHHWLALVGTSLFLFKDCQSLFLRHNETGKCIAASEELVYSNPRFSFPHFVVMTDNCLDNKTEFRFLDSQLLHNIEKEGALISGQNGVYKNRWAVYKGVATPAINYQRNAQHRLKQTAAGSLFFYNKNDPVCAEPDSSNYVLGKTSCGSTKQKFTFGSVTAFNAKMENVHCSSIQHMMVNSADYGDFDNSGTFDPSANIDTQCSKLVNCQVKSRCEGTRSCELTMDNILLPPQYCSDTSKQIYTKYTCVDTNRSSAITTAPNIRLTHQNVGYIEIKDGSVWKKVVEENWNKKRQKALCQHLGFEETSRNVIQNLELGSGRQIASGDLICYNTQLNGTSCCVHLEPLTSTTSTTIPYVRCTICNNPLLHNATTFPDSVFSGRGDLNGKYKDARITKGGWCPSGSGNAYLLLDLQKEYHITEVAVMADKEQTKWSGSYSLKYSHNTSYENSQTILGNKNGHQASRTDLNIYNVRHVRIEPIGKQYFCLRMELCGEVQTPASVSNVNVSPSKYCAHVTWEISTSNQNSSYITHIIIYLNGKEQKIISRGTQVNITNLSPYTSYTVGIQAQDGSSQTSPIVYKIFRTHGAVPLPVISKILSTAPKKYTIFWVQPTLSVHQTVLEYYTSYQALNGPKHSRKVSKDKKFIIVDVEYEKQYTFEIQVVTQSGKSGVASETWIAHSAPLEMPTETNAGYTLKLIKPKEEQKIRNVTLVLLKSESDNPPAPEDIVVQMSPSEEQNNIAFRAKVFDITEFQEETIEISLRQARDKRRGKRNAVVIHALAPMSTYRAAQLNTDESGTQLWSFWSEPFTFNERLCNAGGQQSNVKSIRIDLLIPLVIFVLLFLFSLGVIIYLQRRLILNKNKHHDHYYETPEQAHQKSTSNLERYKKTRKANNATSQRLYVNDEGAYESSDHAQKSIARNEAESQPKISARQESSTYMSLKDNREPENAYQSLQYPNIQTVEYENPAFISYKKKKSTN